jgi:hypothetical protein
VGDDWGLWVRGLAHLFEECELCILVVELLADRSRNHSLCLNTGVALFAGGLVFQQAPHLIAVLASSYHADWLRSVRQLVALPDHLLGDGVCYQLYLGLSDFCLWQQFLPRPPFS